MHDLDEMISAVSDAQKCRNKNAHTICSVGIFHLSLMACVLGSRVSERLPLVATTNG